MPWSSDASANLKEQSKPARTAWAIAAVLLALFALYWGAVWFVTQDCESGDDHKTLVSCPTALEHGWINGTTRTRLLKRLSKAQVDLERYPEALRTFAELEQLTAFGFNEYQNRYLALYFTEKKVEALKDVEAALAIRPDDESANLDYANIVSEIGKLEDARPKLQILLNKDPKNFRALMRLSRVEYDLGNAVVARDLAKRATESENMNAEAHNMLALAYELEGNFPDALDHYSRANLYDKENALYLTNRAMLHYNRENYLAAKFDYDASLKLSRNFDNLYGLAITILEGEEEEPAKPLLDEALRLKPDDLLTHIALGRYHYYVNEYEKARKVLAKAKLLAPDDTRADYWIASIDAAEGKIEEAIKGFRSSLTAWPKSAVVYNDLGHVLLDAKQELDALDAFNKAMELNPTYANSWDGRARVYVWQSEWDKVIADATKAIELDGKRGIAYARRAYAQWWKGNWDKARADYDEAIKLSPEVDWLAIERTEFVISNGEDSEKAAALDQLRNRKLDRVDLLRLEGRLAEAQNDMPQAVLKYRQAAELAPTNVWRQEDLAWAMLYNDERVDGLSACEKMLVIAPKEPSGHRCRARAYRLMFDYENAVKAADDALAMDPNYSAMSVDKAYDLIAQSRYEEAVNVLSPLVRKNYRPDLTRFYRGLAQVELRQPELAIRDFEKALAEARGQLAKDIAMELNRVRSKSGSKGELRSFDYPQLRTQPKS